MGDHIGRKLDERLAQWRPIGYLVLDDGLIVQDGNATMARWLGCPHRELPGQPALALLPALIGVETHVSQLSSDDTPLVIDQVLALADDGTEQFFTLRVERLPAELSGLLLVTVVDVTEQTRQEQLLQQQRNELGLLSSRLTTANEQLAYLLKRFVPEKVAQELISSGRLPALGGETMQEATVLFADMRDFTPLAEGHTPQEVLELLNRYLGLVADTLLAHDGSLVQLVGDMVMAVFNLPESQPDHARRALRAAQDVQNRLRTETSVAGSGGMVGFGIGVSTGTVIAGYLGVQQRYRYAVVGDTTNVAFHLCTLARAGQVLVGETTLELAGVGVEVIPRGPLQLKRRKQPVLAYELVGVGLNDSLTPSTG